MITKEQLVALYAAMLIYRNHAEAAGLEGALAGISLDLARGDALFTDLPATLFAALGNGEEPRRADARWTADLTASAAFAQAARAAKSAKGQRIAVALSSAAAPPASWPRDLARAAHGQLPAVFVYARSHDAAPLAADGRAPAALLAGVPVISVDADDAVAVYRVAGESIARARGRRGPTLIECVTGIGSLLAAANGHAAPVDALASMEAYLRRRRIRVPRPA